MDVPRFDLAPGYDISRLIKGGWQLAGGHGAVDVDAALADMPAFVDAGITTFDCADIYTGVEALIGRFRRAGCERSGRRGGGRGAGAHQVRARPRSPAAPDQGRHRGLVDRSLQRLGVEATRPGAAALVGLPHARRRPGHAVAG